MLFLGTNYNPSDAYVVRRVFYMAYVSALTFVWIAGFRNAMDLAEWTLPLANWYSWTPNEIDTPDRCSTLGNFPQDSIF